MLQKSCSKCFNKYYVHDKSKKNQKEGILHYYVNVCVTLDPYRCVDLLQK